MRICLLLLVGLLVSACDPVVEDSKLLGMNFAGDRVEWTVNWGSGEWSALNRDSGEEFSGQMGADGELVEGMRQADNGAWFVHRAGRGLATSVGTGETGVELSFAVETSVDIETYGALVAGRYTCVRWRDDPSPVSDIVFLTLHDGEFALQAHDSELRHIDSFVYGESTVEMGEGDLEGTWERFGTNEQELRLESGGESWLGVVFPGTSLLVQSPISEGVLACLWSPLPNTQLSVFDGDFYFLESLWSEGGYSPAQAAQVDIFGDAGLYTRDPGGPAEEVFDLTGRGQVYYVGNAITWQNTSESWLYQIGVSDFYLQWTQTGGAPGPDSPPGRMESFGIGFHPRDLHDLYQD